MVQKGRGVHWAAWIAVIVLVVALLALYFALRPGFGLLRLPKDARAALLAETGLQDRPSTLRIREVEQIGPYLAVIYTAAGKTGAGLMSNEAGAWRICGVADPGSLRQSAGPEVGVATVRSGGIEVLFLAVGDRQVARVIVRYPDDGTSLDWRVQGAYAILWRPAPAGRTGFVVESYGRSGRLIAP